MLLSLAQFRTDHTLTITLLFQSVVTLSLATRDVRLAGGLFHERARHRGIGLGARMANTIETRRLFAPDS